MLRKILGPEAASLLMNESLLDPLASVLKVGSLHGKAAEGLEEALGQVCVRAVEVWCTSNIPEEAPTLEW